MKQIKLLIIPLLLTAMFWGCTKNKKTTSQSPALKMYFPQLGGAHWKTYYYAPSGDTFMYQHAIDSIYVSNETVSLKIISDTNPNPTLTTFNILKVFRRGIKFNSSNFDLGATYNYSIIRIDTIANKIYGINTVNYEFPSSTNLTYPSPYNFNERVIYDHNLMNNDTAYVKALWYYYSCDVHIDSIPFGTNFLKRQFFTQRNNPNDTVSHRMQLGCILNSVAYNMVAVPNSIGETNAILTKMVFYLNNTDSIEIKTDQDIYP